MTKNTNKVVSASVYYYAKWGLSPTKIIIKHLMECFKELGVTPCQPMEDALNDAAHLVADYALLLSGENMTETLKADMLEIHDALSNKSNQGGGNGRDDD